LLDHSEMKVINIISNKFMLLKIRVICVYIFRIDYHFPIRICIHIFQTKSNYSQLITLIEVDLAYGI